MYKGPGAGGAQLMRPDHGTLLALQGDPSLFGQGCFRGMWRSTLCVCSERKVVLPDQRSCFPALHPLIWRTDEQSGQIPNWKTTPRQDLVSLTVLLRVFPTQPLITVSVRMQPASEQRGSPVQTDLSTAG